MSDILSDHFTMEGRPGGGTTSARGLAISWQHGPRGARGERLNGANPEDVIEAVIDRLDFFQRFPDAGACPANDRAIQFLRLALDALLERTQDRTARGVEGTWKP